MRICDTSRAAQACLPSSRVNTTGVDVCTEEVRIAIRTREAGIDRKEAGQGQRQADRPWKSGSEVQPHRRILPQLPHFLVNPAKPESDPGELAS